MNSSSRSAISPVKHSLLWRNPAAAKTPARRGVAALLLLLLSAFVALLLALALGPISLPPTELFAALFDSTHPAAPIVRHLRGERALAAFTAGALLALSGAILQLLLRNPLADPYLLGTSGGAAVGALTAILLGLHASLIPAASFLGAIVALLLVLLLSRRYRFSPTPLILTGVIISAGAGALITLLLTLAPDGKLPAMLFWLIGDVTHARSFIPPLLLLIVALVVLFPWGRDLNVLLWGDDVAAALGVAVLPLRWFLTILASLLTAVAVTLVGSLGFIGLIVPHTARLLLGNDQRLLLPASALLGGALLTLADTLARTLPAPQQLPVGVLTALLGVPFFLWLLHRRLPPWNSSSPTP
ncbi:MAG: iron ABC transporter permease [Hydrogenophilus sp.]|nr:iron ABC transporter permease [Hydrogenophilus sp.]